ncbi:MAG: hypothetical protein ACK4VP_04635 [Nitrospira sp.]
MPEAVRWYRLATQHHHRDALYRLCILTDRGLETPQGLKEAAHWCHLATDTGHASHVEHYLSEGKKFLTIEATRSEVQPGCCS